MTRWILCAFLSLSSISAASPPNIILVVNGTTGPAPLLVTFDASNSSTVGGGQLIFSWDFGDGNQGSGAGPTHRFETPGGYIVHLTVSTTSNESADVSVPITVQA